jgi:hypothetical protein
LPRVRGRGRYTQRHKGFKKLIKKKHKRQRQRTNRAIFMNHLECIGLEERDFAMYIQSLEREVNEEIFTIRMLEGEQDPKEENPHFYCLIVFENREIMKSKVSTFEHEDKIAIRTQGKWL